MVLRNEITKQIKDLLKKNPHGLSITEVVGAISINRNTAGRYLENLLVSGQVEMRRFGMAKIYMLSQRVPLSAVLSISSEMVIQLDSNLRIIFANEPFLDLIGTDEKAILGKNIEYTSVASIFDEAFTGFIEKIREGIDGKEWSGEIALDTKDTIVFCRIAPTVFEDGRRGVSVILEDITRRKKANDALQESEDRYRKLVEISPDAVFLHRHGRILYANPAAFRLLGASNSDEIIGKNIFDFIPPSFRESVRANIEKDLEGQESPRIELTMLRVDGTPIVVEGKGIATASNGEPAVQVALRDITEQKHAGTALKIKERQLSSIYSNVPDVLFYLSVEPDNRFRFLTINRSFLDKLHLSEDQVVGKYVNEVIPEPLCSRALGKYNQAIREKKTIRWEEVQDSPAGKKYGESLVTAIFDESGHPTNIIGSVHDSTGHKRLEATLRESEDLYRTLAEASNDLIFVIGRNDRVEYVNSYASALVKKPVNQIVGGPRASLFPPDVARNQKKALDIVFETGNPVRNEGALTFNGQIHWFDHFLTPLKDADDRVRSVLGVSRDITERRKAEEALRESETRLQLILDSTDDIIILQDTEGRILYFNSVSPYGLSEEETLGFTPYDFLEKEVADRIVKRLKNVIKTGKSIKEETSFVWKRETLWFSDSLYPVRERDGTITSVVTVSQNITERKRAEIALSESEAISRALINAPSDSVILIDTRGIILAMNETAASRFGKRSDELIGSVSYDLLSKDVGQSRRLRMAPVHEKKEMVRFVDERDGRWYDTVAYPILNETGELKKIAIIARDITEQKNIEMKLRESEQSFQRLLVQSFDAIAIHRGKKIAFLNDRAAQILGADSPDDLIGRPIFDLIHPDSRRTLEDRLRKLHTDICSPVPVTIEKFFRVDGTVVTVEVMATKFDDNGIPAIRVAFREIATNTAHSKVPTRK